jgi:hypothetical protein
VSLISQLRKNDKMFNKEDLPNKYQIVVLIVLTVVMGWLVIKFVENLPDPNNPTWIQE